MRDGEVNSEVSPSQAGAFNSLDSQIKRLNRLAKAVVLSTAVGQLAMAALLIGALFYDNSVPGLLAVYLVLWSLVNPVLGMALLILALKARGLARDTGPDPTEERLYASPWLAGSPIALTAPAILWVNRSVFFVDPPIADMPVYAQLALLGIMLAGLLGLLIALISIIPIGRWRSGVRPTRLGVVGVGLSLVWLAILTTGIYRGHISYRGPQPVSRRSEAVDSNALTRTAVVATLDCPMQEHKNVIWCSTFQMAWDRFKGDITKQPIKVIGAEELAERLNRARFDAKDLDKDSYYATAGYLQRGILETIRKEMARRFPSEPTPVLDELRRTRRDDIVAYAYLSVDVGFKYPFYTNPHRFVFQDSNGVSIDITSFSAHTNWPDPEQESVREQVEVLYDKPADSVGTDEFAVDLCRHTNPYQIVVACIPPHNTLRQTLSDVDAGIAGFKNDPNHAVLSKLRPIDSLIVPDILYKLMHHFTELEDKHLGNRGCEGLAVFSAVQMIDFALSRRGLTLRSEATFTAGGRDLETPRLFHFNRPFLVYVKKREANASPFFVMWVDNAELMKRR